MQDLAYPPCRLYLTSTRVIVHALSPRSSKNVHCRFSIRGVRLPTFGTNCTLPRQVASACVPRSSIEQPSIVSRCEAS